MSAPNHSDQLETRLRAEYGADETPVEAVVTAVADVTGNSLLEMDPLGEVVDTDALNKLADSRDGRSSPATVTFDYCGQRVTVTSEGVEIAAANASE